MNRSQPTATGAARAVSIAVGKKLPLSQLLTRLGVKGASGLTLGAKVSTPKVCRVIGSSVQGRARGTCKGRITMTRKPGNASGAKPRIQSFTIAVR